MRKVRIAVVGDVHGDWDAAADENALRHLNPDLVLFTGDFGDEDVKLVTKVANLNMPKAVTLGNHDCCWSALKRVDLLYNKLTSSYLDTFISKIASYFRRPAKPAVEEQIERLGNSFVGFKRLEYPNLELSVVGARPFAMGGGGIYGKDLVSSLFGIADLKSSAEKIKELVLAAPKSHSIVVLGHNGPTGLGSHKDDICGADFSGRGGDNGDPDLAEALESCREQCHVPLVVFGHMHRHKDRKMVAVSNGTVYVNGAVVPRKQGKDRQFTVVEMQDKQVAKVAETWVRVPARGETCVSSVNVLFEL